MTKPVDLFYNTYDNFAEQTLVAVRKEIFGLDIGQNSWLTVDELDRFITWLRLAPEHHVLEVASGSGGPARYLARQAGCKLTGIDANESGVAESTRQANESELAGTLSFKVADANAALPFADESFDAILCIDALNHLTNRALVFKEWYRVLRRGKRAVFTDPVVITGPVTNEELALRSSIGLFLFVPAGVNEQLIASAGLNLVQKEDASENAALVSGRWRQSRERHRDDLIKIEGEARFEGIQAFLGAVHRLTAEKRLSRIAYVAEKPAA